MEGRGSSTAFSTRQLARPQMVNSGSRARELNSADQSVNIALESSGRDQIGPVDLHRRLEAVMLALLSSIGSLGTLTSRPSSRGERPRRIFDHLSDERDRRSAHSPAGLDMKPPCPLGALEALS